MSESVTILTKLLVTVDRTAFASNHGLDPSASDVHAELAEMVGDGVAVVPAAPGNPLAEVGATVQVDPQRPWRRHRVRCSDRFSAVKVFVTTQVDPDVVRERFGVEPVHAVPHWLTTHLSQTAVVKDHNGTVSPLIAGR